MHTTDFGRHRRGLLLLAAAVLLASGWAPARALAQSEPQGGQAGGAAPAPSAADPQPPAEDPGPPAAVPSPESAQPAPADDGRQGQAGDGSEGPSPGPAGQGPRVLSEFEQQVLANGPVSQTSWLVGGILGTWMGFGLGHAAQGRYGDGGLIFTGGELLLITVGMVGLTQSLSNDTSCSPQFQGQCQAGGDNQGFWTATMIVGFVGYTVMRVWEAVDVWTGPSRWNEYYRQLRRELGQSPARAPAPSLSLSLLPMPGGASFGAALRF